MPKIPRGGVAVREAKKRIDRSTVKRLGVVMCVFAVVAAALIGVLAKLQLADHAYYKTKVLDQMTVSTEVNPERGTIYDRNGSILAANSSNYLIFISPQDIIDAMEDTENSTVYTWMDSSGADKKGLRMNELIA